MSKKSKFLLILVFLCACILGGFLFVNYKRASDWLNNPGVDTSVYKAYILNTNIDLSSGGNSTDFISEKDGWGDQESEYRCVLNNGAKIRLYVKDGQNTTLDFRVSGFGIYDYDLYPSQEVTVIANGTEVAKWSVADDSEYFARIPGRLMTDNTVEIELRVAHPYTPPVDKRKIGMAVKNITLGTPFAAKTKIKIGKWLKQKLGALPPEMTE